MRKTNDKPTATVQAEITAANGSNPKGGKRSDELVNKAKYRAVPISATLLFDIDGLTVKLPIQVKHLSSIHGPSAGFVSLADKDFPKVMLYGNPAPTAADFDFSKSTGRRASGSDGRHGRVLEHTEFAEWLQGEKDLHGAKQTGTDPKKGMTFSYDGSDPKYPAGKGFIAAVTEYDVDTMMPRQWRITPTRPGAGKKGGSKQKAA